MKTQKIIAFTILLAISNLAHAETRYVTDSCTYLMRSGESTSNKIVRSLKSGKVVEVLGQSKKSGYTHVRSGGKEGYVLSRFLQRSPTAQDRLATVESELNEAREIAKMSTSQCSVVAESEKALKKEAKSLKTENKDLASELAKIKHTAANSLSILKENEKLKKKMLAMDQELQALALRADDLQDSTARDWFLIGAVVLVAGIILGLIVPRIRFQRKTSWDSF